MSNASSNKHISSRVMLLGGMERDAACAGDMPVALMFDGPSLGGFVCPATITSTELWKMGQVSAKDTVLFKPVSLGALLPLPLHQHCTTSFLCC